MSLREWYFLIGAGGICAAFFIVLFVIPRLNARRRDRLLA